MTNPIPAGTANIPVNAPRDERSVWGQLAATLGCSSTASLLRELWLAGLDAKAVAATAAGDQTRALQFTDAARRVREARRQYYGATFLVLFIAMLAIGEGDDSMRNQRARRVRNSSAKTVRRNDMDCDVIEVEVEFV